MCMERVVPDDGGKGLDRDVDAAFRMKNRSSGTMPAREERHERQYANPLARSGSSKQKNNAVVVAFVNVAPFRMWAVAAIATVHLRLLDINVIM
jgi:hypothetical protein